MKMSLGQITKHLSSCVAMLTLIASSAQAGVVAIVNASNNSPVDSTLIAKIFLGQTRTFPDGTTAVPVNQKEGNSVYDEFATTILKRTPTQLKYYWARQIFTGGAVPPRQLNDDKEVVAFIATMPGGVGYVDSSALNNKPDSIKVISLNIK